VWHGDENRAPFNSVVYRFIEAVITGLNVIQLLTGKRINQL